MDTLSRALGTLIGAQAVLAGESSEARSYRFDDASTSRGIRGQADAVAMPSTADQVAAVLGWCYGHDVAVVPRGGGSGYTGGAVPDGGVVLSLERLAAPVRIEPMGWRAYVEAGVRTADVRRRARESGLMFPPDPGAAEQSMIGGNIATNAGGPHAFKYGSTGAWITGVDAVIPPGERVSFGGKVRKDVGGYDLKSLIVGSEGTLAIVTGAWLRLTPTPEAALPVLAVYSDMDTGCAAIERVLETGLVPAALEYLDTGALQASRSALGRAVPQLSTDAAEDLGFVVIAEADGSRGEAMLLRDELIEVLTEGASAVLGPTARADVSSLWQWRDGVSLAVTAQRGGKLSEDIVVPVERLREAIGAILEIGAEHDLPTCSWGHAGDGNLHATFLTDPGDPSEQIRAEAAAQKLFSLATRLGGAVSGEHGIGLAKRGALTQQWSLAAIKVHERIKDTLDPKGLLNPGKKVARLLVD